MQYIGLWENDMRNGDGEMTYPGIMKLKGNWVNN